jgi:hypothetical protein
MLFESFRRQRLRPKLPTHAISAVVLKPMSRWKAMLPW